MRVLVVDDEKPARDRLIALLERQPEVQLVAACAGGADAMAAVSAATHDGAPVNIMFLDVQMPEMDGFTMLESLYALPLERIPIVVFTTAYDEYALRAFDARAIDYLLKPYSDERFETAMSRAIHLARGESSDGLVAKMRALLGEVVTLGERPSEGMRPDYLDRLVIKDRGRVHLVNVPDIRWVAADGVYVTIHTAKRAFLHREVLGRLETNLDPQRFVRIHRSFIVNFGCVHELVVDAHGEYSVKLDDAVTLRVGRAYRSRLEARLNQRR